MKKFKFAGVGLAALMAAPGMVSADNVAFSATDVSLAGGLAQVAGASESSCGTDGALFQKILTAEIDNAGSPKDLVLGLSAETTLLTATTVESKGGQKSTSWADAAIEMCVETESGDGTIVATPGVVTFDRRKQELWAKFNGLNCTADLETGVVTCEDPEEVGLLLDTTAAHHFNFIVQNPGPGSITINAYARVTCSKSDNGEDPVPGCNASADSTATSVNAAIGNASLVAFEVQAANK